MTTPNRLAGVEPAAFHDGSGLLALEYADGRPVDPDVEVLFDRHRDLCDFLAWLVDAGVADPAQVAAAVPTLPRGPHHAAA